MTERPIQDAVKALKELSLAPYAQRLAEARMLAEQNFRMTVNAARKEGREEGREEGRQEGSQEGRCELVLTLLSARFGEVPEAVEERLRAASSVELEEYATRLLTVKSPEELLD